LSLPVLIPIINLQRNQDANDHNENLNDHIQQVFAELVISYKSLTYLAEEAEHWHWLLLPQSTKK
jgi:hypothetical protein